jgi:hypothetical protein
VNGQVDGLEGILWATSEFTFDSLSEWGYVASGGESTLLNSATYPAELIVSGELTNGLFEQTGSPCTPGDVDGNGDVDIDDPVYMISFIFSEGPEPAGGPCCGDADGSLGLDIDDAVWLINFIFAGGLPPDPDACDNW